MSLVHGAGVPWLLALPATALTIRTFLIYPIINRRRRNLSKLALLQPLVDARISHYILQTQWTRVSKFVEPGSFTTKARVRSKRRREELELEKHFRIPTARFMSKIIPILILLTVTEGLRRLCGTQRGLLSILLGPVQPYISRAVTQIVEAVSQDGEEEDEEFQWLGAPDPDAGEILQKGLHFAYREVLANYTDFQTDTWLEPSLEKEGLPWCQDLTQPDPQHILPVIFSSAFFASIFFSPKEVKRGTFYNSSTSQQGGARSANSGNTTNEGSSPKRTKLQKLMLGVSVLSIVPAWNMPVALLWYYIFNIAISRLQTRRVNMKFPITVPPLACSRRAQMMSSLGKSTPNAKSGVHTA
ncbi:hypothetical protein CAC42_2632 [Sphaceloma murrayae]|uniref:Uncharacterized protein n=1 Tax=Sphaceloma murrayae TaxID=2082308 RepID=A0A2K1QHE7_9PEZI|nr:hypothetical protein CAC42_2632 [Sphaceloma murrayae]